MKFLWFNNPFDKSYFSHDITSIILRWHERIEWTKSTCANQLPLSSTELPTTTRSQGTVPASGLKSYFTESTIAIGIILIIFIVIVIICVTVLVCIIVRKKKNKRRRLPQKEFQDDRLSYYSNHSPLYLYYWSVRWCSLLDDLKCWLSLRFVIMLQIMTFPQICDYIATFDFPSDLWLCCKFWLSLRFVIMLQILIGRMNYMEKHI